jgi:hypothetical protein
MLLHVTQCKKFQQPVCILGETTRQTRSPVRRIQHCNPESVARAPGWQSWWLTQRTQPPPVCGRLQDDRAVDRESSERACAPMVSYHRGGSPCNTPARMSFLVSCTEMYMLCGIHILCCLRACCEQLCVNVTLIALHLQTLMLSCTAGIFRTPQRL